jgi:hypothetical protein
MPSRRFGLHWAHGLMGALALSLILLGGAGPVSAAGAASSPQDRARFISVTRSLEAAPLDPALQADREWALKWITKAPDVSVGVCLDALGGVAPKDYPYGRQVLLQYMFSMAALVIEHPETARDENAQQLAGVEGALKVYRAIAAGKPDGKSSNLETLLKAQTEGRLPDVVQKASARCKAQATRK